MTIYCSYFYVIQAAGVLRTPTAVPTVSQGH